MRRSQLEWKLAFQALKYKKNKILHIHAIRCDLQSIYRLPISTHVWYLNSKLVLPKILTWVSKDFLEDLRQWNGVEGSTLCSTALGSPDKSPDNVVDGVFGLQLSRDGHEERDEKGDTTTNSDQLFTVEFTTASQLRVNRNNNINSILTSWRYIKLFYPAHWRKRMPTWFCWRSANCSLSVAKHSTVAMAQPIIRQKVNANTECRILSRIGTLGHLKFLR